MCFSFISADIEASIDKQEAAPGSAREIRATNRPTDGTPYIEIQVRRNIKNRDAIYRRRGGSAPTSSRIVLHNSAINLHPPDDLFFKAGLPSLLSKRRSGTLRTPLRPKYVSPAIVNSRVKVSCAQWWRINPMNINYNLHDINRHYRDSWPKFVDVHWLQTMLNAV